MPINICLDCTIEKKEDIVMNANNSQPPYMYYVCDTCPLPGPLQVFLDSLQVFPEYPWNPVQTACEGPGARIPVLVKLNRWGSGNGAPTYSQDTELRISLSYVGPIPPPLTPLHSGVVGKAKVGELNWEPCPGGPVGCVQDTVWMIIPKDILQTINNPPVYSPGGFPFQQPTFAEWFIRVNAYHPDVNEAVDSVPGFTGLHPNADCMLVDTFGTITSFNISRPNYKPELALLQVLTDCLNDVSLITFFVTNHEPNRSYIWYIKNHTTGVDSLIITTNPDINALLTDVLVNDSITCRVRVATPGCLGPIGDYYTFYADKDTGNTVTAVISGEVGPIVEDTVTYFVTTSPYMEGSWSLKQGRGHILEQTDHSVTVYWDTPGWDTLIYNLSHLPFNEYVCGHTFTSLPIGVHFPDFMISYQKDTLIFADAPFNVNFIASCLLNSTANPPGVNYHWSWSDGGTADGDSVSHVFPAPGEYSLVLTGAYDYGDYTLTDTLSDVFTIKLQIGRPELETTLPVKLYPNPAQSSFTIEGPRDGKVEVFDVLGRKRYETVLYGETKTVCSTSDWPRGVYLVRLFTADGRTKTLSLVLSD